MPRPRLLTDLQEAAALAEFRAAASKYGAIASIARKYNVSWPGMKGIIDRAAVREATSEVPSETLNSAEPQS